MLNANIHSILVTSLIFTLPLKLKRACPASNINLNSFGDEITLHLSSFAHKVHLLRADKGVILHYLYVLPGLYTYEKPDMFKSGWF